MSLFRKTSQDIDLIVFHSHGHLIRGGLACKSLGGSSGCSSIGVSNKMLVGSHDHLSSKNIQKNQFF